MTSPLAALVSLPGVEPALSEARGAVDVVLGHRALRRKGPELSLESSLRGARASAALEGVDVELEFLRSGNLRLDHPGRPIAQAALRVAAEVAQLGDVWRRSPAQALARLHTVASADLADTLGVDSVGRPRMTAPTDNPLNLPDAVPAHEVAPRLELLSEVIAASSDVPAVVVAAVIHGELLTLRPFGSRDGLVARGAYRLALITRGLDPRGVTIPESGHASFGRAIYAAAAQGFASGTAEGLAGWLVHCAQSVERGAIEAALVADALEA